MQSLLALTVRALLPTRTQWYGSFFIIDTFRIYDFRRCRIHSVLIVKKSKHSDSYRKLSQLMQPHPRTNPRFLNYSMSILDIEFPTGPFSLGYLAGSRHF